MNAEQVQEIPTSDELAISAAESEGMQSEPEAEEVLDDVEPEAEDGPEIGATSDGGVAPSKQITYPASHPQVIRGPNGSVLVIHTPGEVHIFPWPTDVCERVASELKPSRVEVVPATAMGDVKRVFEERKRQAGRR